MTAWLDEVTVWQMIERALAAGAPVDSINTSASEVRVLEAKVLAEQQAVLQVQRPHTCACRVNRGAQMATQATVKRSTCRMLSAWFAPAKRSPS